MKERTSAVITIGFLCGILLVFAWVDLVNGSRKYSEMENRRLTERPLVSTDTILNGQFMELYENYVTDQFAGRDKMIALKTNFDVLMQKKQINGVYLCADGYLIEQHLPEDYKKEQVEEKVALLARLVERYDAQVMLIPTADNILSEKLPYGATYYDQTALLEQVKEAVGEDNYIDVYKALSEHAQEEIYYRTDNHWTTLGAYYGYMEWKRHTDAMAVVTFWPEELTPVTDDFLGTLHSKTHVKTGADTIQMFPKTLDREPGILYDYHVEAESFYEPEHLATKNKYGYFLDGNHAIAEIDTGYHRGRELILIKDSNANSMVPLLANNYDKIYVIDLRYYSGTLASLVREYETENTHMLVLYDCIRFMEDFMYY